MQKISEPKATPKGMPKTPKWKYVNPQKKKNYETYVRLEVDKTTKMRISDWTFTKNAYSESLFSCSVIELNGEKVDKIWSVWDFDLKEALKKKLKTKNPNKDKAEITVTKREKDEVEEFFELK